MSHFVEMDPSELLLNPFDSIEKPPPLTAAGTREAFNAMTIAWGGLGRLWNKPVFYLFVRPSRYTYQFTEREAYFSVCYFDARFKTEINYFGTVSGRDEDKTAKSGFTAAFDLAPITKRPRWC
jgi:flavin reductase (DIM6/NTAB) family NADH-FMN oxidoreductase RutF